MSPVATSIHPSYLTWLGLTHEKAYGDQSALVGGATPVGPVWTLPLDASTFEPEDKPLWLRDMAIRGSMAEVYAITQGVEDSAWSLGGPVYPGITPILLDNMFGDITTTPTGGSATGSVVLSAAYTRNSSGTQLTVAAATGFTTPGVVGQISGGGFTEYFTTSALAAAGTTIYMTAPLHYNYPVTTTTVKVYAGATSYSHKFAALNAYDGQPPTWTALDSTNVTDANADVYGQRYYTSLCMAQLDFTLSSEALFTQKASGTAWISGPTTALATPATSAFTPSTVTTVPVPSWSSIISLSLPVGGGLTQVNYVGEVTFSLKRKIQVYWTDDGSQNPFIIARGPLGVTGTVKAVVAQDEQVLQSMLKNFQGSLSAVVTVPATTPYPAGEQGLTFTFNVNNAAFTAAKPTRSAVLVGYDASFEGVANTTNVGQTGGLGPITISCTDLVPGY